MTAIASAFTYEGFVIGADGRQLGNDKTIFSECSQKIFNFKHRHVNVAYRWCGETEDGYVYIAGHPSTKVKVPTANRQHRVTVRPFYMTHRYLHKQTDTCLIPFRGANWFACGFAHAPGYNVTLQTR